MLVDFHTHTTASDGALSPTELVQRARDRGIAALAITDHDTMKGYLEVAATVSDGLRLYPGVELSCVWGGVNVHVVGLGGDIQHPAILEMLEMLHKARFTRSEIIAARLAKAGMPGALVGARAAAGDSQIGRPHFAEWLVCAGHCADINAAFDRWLGRGKTGDVKACWPPLSEVVQAIVSSGGVAVLAHPLKYGLTGMKLRALVGAFRDTGGGGIEVLSGRQTQDEVARLRRLAGELGLAMSLGSDFHRDWAYGPDLGVDASEVGSGQGIWELLS